MSKPKKIHPCDKCERNFGNAGALGNHKRVAHPPPPPDVVEYEIDRGNYVDSLETSHTLVGGGELKPSDVFYRVEKCIVTGVKRRKVNGVVVPNKDGNIFYKVVGQHWQNNKKPI